jgi:hypothetical protein
MTAKKIMPAVVVGAIVIALLIYGPGFLGPVGTLIMGSSAVLAYFAWLFTTFKTPADPQAILPLYLLVVGTELIHMSEEAIADFPGRFGRLFDTDISFFAPLVLLAGGIWVIAGVGLIYKNPVANFFVWFVAIGPGIINGIAHVTFPFLAGTLYFPGLITVIFPFAASVLLIRLLLQVKPNIA